MRTRSPPVAAVRTSSPTKAGHDERSSSPSKIRAKITQGISPKRKPNKNASPPKPNIVRTLAPAVDPKGHRSNYVEEDSQGLGISMADRSTIAACCVDEYGERAEAVEDESDVSGTADSSFVFHDAEAGSASHANSTDAVTVHLRLRPQSPSEPSAWVPSPRTSSLTMEPSISGGRSSGLGQHNFDAVHVGSSNDKLYKTLARPLVHSVLSGFNALIFAYGQTASGKTFTLSGDEKSGAEGITQKAVKDLFRGIRGSKREREWLVRCSWLEVYNESLNDLLEPTNAPQVRSSQARGTFVSPLSEVIVTSPSAVFSLLEQGQANRHVNATDWNERSSRSHTAFKIVVESWSRGSDPGGRDESSSSGRKKVRVSELVLVDLAGSERYVTQGGKERRAEGANINKSLLTLGKVIYALSERANGSATASPTHIPYRDSKLTRILQNSLSGNSKIAVVATLNQSVGALEESLSTISFAKRIKRVQLSAKLNEIEAPDSSEETQALLVRYRSEANALRRLVSDLQQKHREQDMARDVAASKGQQSSVVEDRIGELEERLREIGRFVVRGDGSGSGYDDDEMEGDEAAEESGIARPCTPLATPRRPQTPNSMPGTPTRMNFTLPAAALRQELHAAHLRISSLQSRIDAQDAGKPQDLPESEKDALILKLQRQLAEAEIAIEASALQPLPKTREDVEAEYAGKVKRLEKELAQAKVYNEECLRECERLEKANQRLVGLAHRETAELVGRLKEETGVTTPMRDGAGSGTTPAIRRLKGMASVANFRPRPISVLGSAGLMKAHHNSASPGSGDASSDTEGTLSSTASPFATPRAHRETPSVRLQTPSKRQVSRTGSSTMTPFGTGGMTRSETLVMTLQGGNSSDDENADESALLDF